MGNSKAIDRSHPITLAAVERYLPLRFLSDHKQYFTNDLNKYHRFKKCVKKDYIEITSLRDYPIHLPKKDLRLIRNLQISNENTFYSKFLLHHLVSSNNRELKRIVLSDNNPDTLQLEEILLSNIIIFKRLGNISLNSASRIPQIFYKKLSYLNKVQRISLKYEAQHFELESVFNFSNTKNKHRKIKNLKLYVNFMKKIFSEKRIHVNPEILSRLKISQEIISFSWKFGCPNPHLMTQNCGFSDIITFSSFFTMLNNLELQLDPTNEFLSGADFSLACQKLSKSQLTSLRITIPLEEIKKINLKDLRNSLESLKLKRLSVEMKYSSIEDFFGLREKSNSLESLMSLKLIISKENFTNKRRSFLLKTFLSKFLLIRSLSLNTENKNFIKDDVMIDLASGLSNLKFLESLELNFTNSKGVTDKGFLALSKALTNLNELRDIFIALERMQISVGCFIALGQTFSSLSNLSRFELKFDKVLGRDEIGMYVFGYSLLFCKKLHSISLHFDHGDVESKPFQFILNVLCKIKFLKKASLNFGKLNLGSELSMLLIQHRGARIQVL